MSMADIRAAFEKAAGSALRLDHLALRYQNSGQVLDVTGWHADATPFAFVSAPFDSDPNVRIAEIAADLIRLHTGKPPQPASDINESLIVRLTSKPPKVQPPVQKISRMPASQSITGLAALLRQHLAVANARAQKLADDFPTSVATLHSKLDEADKIKTDIDQASADLHDALGGGNGGPPLSDTPPSSQAS